MIFLDKRKHWAAGRIIKIVQGWYLSFLKIMPNCFENYLVVSVPDFCKGQYQWDNNERIVEQITKLNKKPPNT